MRAFKLLIWLIGWYFDINIIIDKLCDLCDKLSYLWVI